MRHPKGPAGTSELQAGTLFPMAETERLTGELFPAPEPRELEHATGILPSQLLRDAIDRTREIQSLEPIGDDQIQPASLDLRLGGIAYRVRASCLPGAHSEVIDRVKAMDGYEVDLTGGAVLESGHVYVIPLQEMLNLPAAIRGFANPKSTTGRLDILTRLIT